MRRKIPISLVLGAAVLLLALPAAAQSVSEGTITGTVYVTTGEVLPGVALTLKGPALVTGERAATSDARGRFVFMSVLPGPANDGLFGELIHPNAAGHRVKASAVLAALASGGLLPGATVPSGLTEADPLEPWPRP